MDMTSSACFCRLGCYVDWLLEHGNDSLARAVRSRRRCNPYLLEVSAKKYERGTHLIRTRALETNLILQFTALRRASLGIKDISVSLNRATALSEAYPIHQGLRTTLTHGQALLLYSTARELQRSYLLARHLASASRALLRSSSDVLTAVEIHKRRSRRLVHAGGWNPRARTRKPHSGSLGRKPHRGGT